MSNSFPQTNNPPQSPQSPQSPPLSPDATKTTSAPKHDNLIPSDSQQGPLTPPATPMASGPEFSDEDFTSSNNNTDTDKEGNLVSIDNTNAASTPSDDSIGVSEIPSKGDMTPLDTQSNDVTDAVTVTAAMNTATVEDDTIAKTVASTVSSAGTVAAAIADSGAASESDSAVEDVVGSGADDVVNTIAALKPTTVDATGAVGESTVAANDIAVNKPPASTTATITTTVDDLTPVEDTTTIAITEDVVVANAIAAAQDTVRSAEISTSIESPSTVPVESSSVVPVESPSVVPVETFSTAAVETTSSTLADSAITTSVTEETLAHASATNHTSSAEEHPPRQKDKASQADKELEVEEDLESAKKKSLKEKKPAKKDEEPMRKEDLLKKEKERSEKKKERQQSEKKKGKESVRKEEPVKEAKEEPKAARGKEKTRLPSHSFIDTRCSYVDSKVGRRCPSRVLTVNREPYFCQDHSSRGPHGDFVYSNKHISILLVKDFEARAKRYPPRKRAELQAKIENHFQTLFQKRDIAKNSLGGLEGTIEDQRRISYVKKGFLYTFDYTKNVTTKNTDGSFTILMKIGHATSGLDRFPKYRVCNIRDKPLDKKIPLTPLSTFPNQEHPHAKRPGPVVGCLTLFEKLMHCLYREDGHRNYFCENGTCKVMTNGHREIFPINGKGSTYCSARGAVLRRIKKDVSRWEPFFTLLGSDIGSSCLWHALNQVR